MWSLIRLTAQFIVRATHHELPSVNQDINDCRPGSDNHLAARGTVRRQARRQVGEFPQSGVSVPAEWIETFGSGLCWWLGIGGKRPLKFVPSGQDVTFRRSPLGPDFDLVQRSIALLQQLELLDKPRQ